MLFYSSLKFYTIFVNDLKGAKNAFLSLCIVRDLLSKERIITDFTSCSLNSTAPLQPTISRWLVIIMENSKHIFPLRCSFKVH